MRRHSRRRSGGQSRNSYTAGDGAALHLPVLAADAAVAADAEGAWLPAWLPAWLWGWPAAAASVRSAASQARA
jgi:hypothetical protein